MNAVFHLRTGDAARWDRAIGNIQNLLDDPTIDCENVVLVVNSDGVEVLRKQTKFADEIETLLDRDVDISACDNTLTNSKLGPSDLYPGIGTVPSAMGALVRLQGDGYAYINP